MLANHCKPLQTNAVIINENIIASNITRKDYFPSNTTPLAGTETED